MHWRNAAGQYIPFDNRLQPADPLQAAKGWTYHTKSTPFVASFGKRVDVANDRPVLRVAMEGAAVTMTAVGANPSGMSVNGAKLVYQNAYPNADIEYTVADTRVKEAVVLRSAPATTASANLTYDLELEGVSVTRRADNSIDFLNPSGKVVFRMPRPFMVDSSNQPETGYSNAIGVSLRELGADKVRLELLPDLAWLQDSARTYPVVVDPTLQAVSLTPDGTTGQDTPIYEANPTLNYAGHPYLDVGKRSDGLRRDTLIQFPGIDSLPADSTVTSATLKLYASSGTVGVPMEVRRITAHWDESTVTWAADPSSTTHVWNTVNSTVPGWNLFDVSGLVRGWLGGDLPNHGVRLMSPGTLAGRSTQFASSDSTNSANHPQLEVRYVPGTRYGNNGTLTYEEQRYDNENGSAVDVSTGDLVFQHNGGWLGSGEYIDTSLTHTYNSEDSHGQTSPYERPGPFYGEGWQFSQDMRLHETVDGGVVLKGGSGDNQVYAKSGDNGTTQERRYLEPSNYPYALTKYLNKPATDPQVYKLAPADFEGETMYFDGEGKLTRREYDLSESLTYSYDATGRMKEIRGANGQVIVSLEYTGPGSPARLSKLTELSKTPARVSTYGYDAMGNLTTIKHGVGTLEETTTTLGYDVANQLTSVTIPTGQTSYIRYKAEHRWDTANDLEGWTGSNLSQSTQQAFRGAGSLRMDVSIPRLTTQGSFALAYKTFTTPVAWNSTSQDVWAFVYLPAGQMMDVRLNLQDSRDQTLYGPITPANGGQWTAIRLPGAHVDPGLKIRGVTLEAVSNQYLYSFGYNGPVWLDHLIMKGVPESFGNVSFGYNWAGRQTTVTRTDGSATPGSVMYAYDINGRVTSGTPALGTEYQCGEDLVMDTATGPETLTQSCTEESNNIAPETLGLVAETAGVCKDWRLEHLVRRKTDNAVVFWINMRIHYCTNGKTFTRSVQSYAGLGQHPDRGWQVKPGSLDHKCWGWGQGSTQVRCFLQVSFICCGGRSDQEGRPWINMFQRANSSRTYVGWRSSLKDVDIIKPSEGWIVPTTPQAPYTAPDGSQTYACTKPEFTDITNTPAGTSLVQQEAAINALQSTGDPTQMVSTQTLKAYQCDTLVSPLVVVTQPDVEFVAEVTKHPDGTATYELGGSAPMASASSVCTEAVRRHFACRGERTLSYSPNNKEILFRSKINSFQLSGETSRQTDWWIISHKGRAQPDEGRTLKMARVRVRYGRGTTPPKNWFHLAPETAKTEACKSTTISINAGASGSGINGNVGVSIPVTWCDRWTPRERIPFGDAYTTWTGSAPDLRQVAIETGAQFWNGANVGRFDFHIAYALK